MNICILKDKKLNESRTPLIPEDILLLKNKFPKINFFIESSKSRIISNRKYFEVGCQTYKNQKIDLFLSINKVSLKKIYFNQNYMMFYPIAKKPEANISFLKRILKKNCSLIDYGLIRIRKKEIITNEYLSIIHPYESSRHFSKKLTSALPKILKKINDDSIESYYICKKGYLNYRYLNLLNCLIES